MLEVFVACKNAGEAEKIAKDLVGRGLAACANYYPVSSYFQWNGKLRGEKEVMLQLKTVEGSYRILQERIRKLHSYELPGIVAIQAPLVESNYLRWVQYHSTGRQVAHVPMPEPKKKKQPKQTPKKIKQKDKRRKGAKGEKEGASSS